MTNDCTKLNSLNFFIIILLSDEREICSLKYPMNQIEREIKRLYKYEIV